jgi:ubiquinone/menaquinone biosynthesis C-methylase UbiE
MDKPMSSAGFKFISLIFKIRDFLRPRMNLLKEAGIEPGYCVLDYGCGPGSYIAPLARLVGTLGEVYALDIHPLAIRAVRKTVARKAIMNVKAIESDCNTGLPDNHVDVILLYDTFHNLCQPDDVLRELHRVLKSDGTLSFSDHHMNEKDILTSVTNKGLFKLLANGKKTYSFSKADQQAKAEKSANR